MKRTVFKSIIAGILVFVVTVIAEAADPNGLPSRIILNLTSAPATSIAVTWRMEAAHEKAEIQYAVATPGTEFKKALVSEPARCETLSVPHQPRAYHYSVVLRNLKPECDYVYRVGVESNWSEWNQFRTAAAEADSFTFIYFGDPQNDITEHVSRVLRQTVRTAPAGDFWLFSGDITSEPEDDQIGAIFDAGGFLFRTIPSVMVPGNHDIGYAFKDGDYALNDRGRRTRGHSVSPLWRGHYTLPENGIPGLEETSFTFDYQGVRFIMLNSNVQLEEQAEWMRGLLADNPNRWTIVSFHHPVYSSGADRDERRTRNAFLPLFDEYGVDIVLTGHDHTYARTHPLRNNAVAPEGEKGTVYLTTSSGPKFYKYTARYDSLMAKTAENHQLFQVITVNQQAIHCTTYTASGMQFDAFQIRK